MGFWLTWAGHGVLSLGCAGLWSPLPRLTQYSSLVVVTVGPGPARARRRGLASQTCTSMARPADRRAGQRPYPTLPWRPPDSRSRQYLARATKHFVLCYRVDASAMLRRRWSVGDILFIYSTWNWYQCTINSIKNESVLYGIRFQRSS